MIPLTEWPQFQGEISSGAAYLSNNLFTCSSSFLPRFWYLFFFFFLFHLLSFALFSLLYIIIISRQYICLYLYVLIHRYSEGYIPLIEDFAEFQSFSTERSSSV